MLKKQSQRNVLSILLSIILVLSSIMPVMADAVKLKDISGNPYEKIISKWVDKGYIKGNPDGTFRPNNQVKRAEMMALINRALNYKEMVEPQFSDVSKKDWYYNDIGIAVKAGYVQGYNGKINPKDNISRQEFAVILANLGKLDTKASQEELKKMEDVASIPEWSKGAIGAALSKKLFDGFVSTKFNPTEKISRIETVVVLDRLLALLSVIELPGSSVPGSAPATPSPTPSGNVSGGNGGKGGDGSIPQAVVKPSAIPDGGRVSLGTKLTLVSLASESTIRYTFGDGTQGTPTQDTGNVYDENNKPVINQSGTFKIKAFKTGMAPSEELKVTFIVVDAITGTAFDSENHPLKNKALGFASSSDTFTVQTDENGFFSTHIRINLDYAVNSEGLNSKISSTGALGGVKVTNTTGKIELGKVLINGSNRVVLQTGVFILGQSFAPHVTYQPDASTVTFDQVMDLVPGDIIILPPTTDNPSGLAVKIQNITFSGGKTTVTVTSPDFREIFNSIKGHLNDNLSTQYFTPEPGVEVINQQAASQPNTLARVQAITAQASDVQENNKISIRLGQPQEWSFEGALEFNGSVSGDIDWAWELDLVDSFDFNVKGQQTLSGTVQYVKPSRKNIEVKVGEMHIPTEVPGVTIDLPIMLVIGAEGKFSVAYKVTMNENVGLKYDDANGMRMYPDDNFQIDANRPVVTLSGEVKAGLKLDEYIAGFGSKMVGISEAIGFFAEASAQSTAAALNINYGIFMNADVRVPIVNWVSSTIEKKITLGTFTLGDEITDFRITPAYLDLTPGQSKTFTLQVKDTSGTWQYLNDEQFAGLDFSSSNPSITHLGKGEVKAASDAGSDTATVTFKLGEFTRTATVKIVTAYGALQGIVKDAKTNEPLPGAMIIIYDGEQDIDKRTTTSESGQFNLQVPAGSGYKAVITKDGYIPELYSNIEISAERSTYLETILQVNERYSGVGTVSGKIVNALDGSGVSGLTLNLRKGINVRAGAIVASTQSGTGGAYSIADLDAGNYTGEIIGDGYSTTYFTIVCLGGLTWSGQDATVTPNMPEGQTRIVLTWGETPRDLDSHLTGPQEDGSRFHTWFNNKSYPGFADLDLDDTTSYGPETTTIRQQIDGVYRFTVHDFTNRSSSNSTALSNSGATVKVYRGEYLVATYYVPTNQGGTAWTVFELSGNTLTPINQMSYNSNYANLQSLQRAESDTQVTDDVQLLIDLPEKDAEVQK